MPTFLSIPAVLTAAVPTVLSILAFLTAAVPAVVSILAVLTAAAPPACAAGGRWLARPVVFRFKADPPAKSVAVAGSFNNWSRDAAPMSDDDGDGIWEATLSLEPETYPYKFVVDGTEWFADPDNPRTVPDGFGGVNSIRTVDFDPKFLTPAAVDDGKIDTLAVHHDPDGIDQVLWSTAEYPAVRYLSLRLCVKKGDVESAGVRIYRIDARNREGFRDYGMDVYATTGPLEYRSITIPFPDDPEADELHTLWRGYRLWIDDGGDLLWVGLDGTARNEDKVRRIRQLLRPTSPGGTAPGTIAPEDMRISDRIVTIPAWAPDAVFYQVFPERFRNGDPTNDPAGTLPWGSAPPSAESFFGGDLQGVIDALPYLDSLGVNVLYLNPIFSAPSNHKYDTTDFKSVDPHFGSEELLRKLVDRAHRRGMKVVLDGVFNHVSDRHPWFLDAMEFGRTSAFWSWFKIKGDAIFKAPEPNYDAWSGLGSMPELNTDNPEVRDYLFGVIRLWMDTGIDGWRLDVPEELPHLFWVQVRATVKAMKPASYIVGEVWGNGRPWLRGDQFDAVMNYRFRDACLAFFAGGGDGGATGIGVGTGGGGGDGAARVGGDAAAFDEALGLIRVDTPEPLDRISYNLLGSHDTARLLTACGGDERKARLAALFQMTYLGAPAVYYGDEVGMTGDRDPGCRGTFPWATADQNGSLREFYRTLLHARRDHPALRRGSFITVLAEGGHYVYIRQSAQEILMVVLNRTDEPASFKLKVPRGVTGVSQKDAVDLLTGNRHGIRSGEVYVKDIAPMSGAILQLK